MKKSLAKALMFLLCCLPLMGGLPEAIVYLHPGARVFTDYAVSDSGSGQYISFWNTNTLGAFPTQQELDAAIIAAAGQAFQDARRLTNYFSEMIVFQQDYWTNLANWRVIGTPPVITNGALRFDPAGVSFEEQAIQLTNYLTMSDSLDVVATFVSRIPEYNYGVYIALVNSNTYCGWEFSYQSTVSVTNCDAIWYDDTTGTVGSRTNYGQSGVTIRSNDTFRVTVGKRGLTMNTMIENLTTGTQFTLRRREPYPPVFFAVKLGSFGGEVDLIKFEIIQPQLPNPDLLIIGDSKTAGYESSSDETRYAGGLTAIGSINIFAGACARTREVLLGLPGIISQKPKRVMINIGRNDLESGVSFSTYTNNYASIVQQLRNAGAIVYHLKPIPETHYNQQAVTDYIASYPSNVIDISTNWVHAIHLDTVTAINPNIHPSPAGQRFIGSEIRRLSVFPTNDILKPFRMPSFGGTSYSAGWPSGGTTNISVLLSGGVLTTTLRFTNGIFIKAD